MDLHDLAKALCRVLPQYGPEQRPLALALYRMLAHGQPISIGQVADAAVMTEPTARALLDSPALRCNTLYDDEGRVAGFGGLATGSTHHRLVLGQRTLFTWCAWDAFFIPAILEEAAILESGCPETSETVRVTIDALGCSNPSHPDARVSFVVPRQICHEVHAGMAEFCHKVFLLASPAAAARWNGRNPGGYLLNLDQAFALGRIKNAMQFGPDTSQS